MGPLTKLAAIITAFGIVVVAAAFLLHVYGPQDATFSVSERMGLLVGLMIALGGALLGLVGVLRDHRARVLARQREERLRAAINGEALPDEEEDAELDLGLDAS